MAIRPVDSERSSSLAAISRSSAALSSACAARVARSSSSRSAAWVAAGVRVGAFEFESPSFVVVVSSPEASKPPFTIFKGGWSDIPASVRAAAAASAALASANSASLAAIASSLAAHTSLTSAANDTAVSSRLFVSSNWSDSFIRSVSHRPKRSATIHAADALTPLSSSAKDFAAR